MKHGFQNHLLLPGVSAELFKSTQEGESKAMSRKQYARMEQNSVPIPTETITEQKPETVLVVGTECETSIVPKPTLGRFVAPECHACKRMELPNRRHTFVNGTETKINTRTELIISRLIKCSDCGNTWMDYERIKHPT